MPWYAVVVANGELYSFGTVLANPLPPEYTALPLQDADAEALLSGVARWDAQARGVVMLPSDEPGA